MSAISSEYERTLREKLIEAEYRNRFLDYHPSKKQQEFHIAGLTAQERLIGGGNRSGKSHVGQREFSAHTRGFYPSLWEGYRFDRPIDCWYIGKTSDLVAETIQKDLFGDESLGSIGMITPDNIISKTRAGSSKMYRTVYIKSEFGGASKVTFKTYEEHRETFQGAKKDLVIFDEEPPIDIYMEAKMRTMQTSSDFRGMTIVCATPLKGYTDFCSYFMEGRHQGVAKDSIWYDTISWEDCEHLSEEEKRRMISGMSPREIEARTKGIPWPGSGMCYPIPEDMVLCQPFEIPPYWRKLWAIDFGWQHPTAVIFLAHDTDNDVIYAYGEYAVSERTVENHLAALGKMGIHKIPGVYDPAGKISRQGDGEKIIELYKKSGLRNVSPAKNSVEAGLDAVLTRMQNGQLKIFSTLTKTISEMRKYSRDDEGVPRKINDDLMDCLRYGVMGISSARKEGGIYDNHNITNFGSTAVRPTGSYTGGGWMGL